MRRLVLLLLLLTLPVAAFAGNDPPPASNVLYGFYFNSFTLTAAAPGPNYYVIGDVFIQPGVTMTIQPGVIVYFAANHDTLNGGDYFYDSEILCEGAVVAVGTAADSIYFKSDAVTPQKGDWGQIKFAGSGQGVFEHCVITDGVFGLRTVAGPLAVRSSRIGNIQGHGVSSTVPASLLVTDCKLVNITGDGVSAPAGGILTVTDNYFYHVAWHSVYLNGGTGNIDSNQIEGTGGDQGIHVENAGSTCRIRWNKISHVYDGVYVGGSGPAMVVLSDTVEYARNHGFDISLRPDTLRFCQVSESEHGMFFYAPAGTVVENCLIYRCANTGVSALGDCYYTMKCKMKYTTIAFCGIGFSSDASANLDLEIDNCIIVSNNWGIRRLLWASCQTLPDADVRFVDVWNNSTAYVNTQCDEACFSINPLFVNAAANDFHLLSNSPLKVFGEGGTQMGCYGPDQGEVTGLEHGDPNILPAYLLLNYPNPFKTSTTITLMAKEPSLATMEVFGLSGQLIRRQDGIGINQGQNEIRIDREGLSAGVYFYRLTVPGYSEARRIVVTD